MNESTKYRILLLGGCGFIGRHILKQLLEEDLAVEICVADKVPPQIAWMNPQQLKMFDNPLVTFKSVNLMVQSSCEAVFNKCDWDWVINAAGETKLGQEDAVYKEGALKLSSNCALAAAKKQVSIYLEISTGMISSSEKVAHKESDVCHPWTSIAKYKCEAENVIRETTGLNWIIVRPGLVYGPTDKLGLTSRLLIGAVYKYLSETMKLLWDEKLKVNTVHVIDLARAVVWLCKRGKTKEVYNIVDENNTTQGHIANLLSEIFQIDHEYLGSVISNIAQNDASGLVAEINEKHLSPWAKMCSEGGVLNTPLSPYLDNQALPHAHIHLDGSKLRDEGFIYTIERPSFQNLMEIIDEYVAMKLFPATALPK